MGSKERFGNKVIQSIEGRYPRTYFVGGMVRDKLLGKNVTDIDITTEATPDEALAALHASGIKTDARHRRFGVIEALQGDYVVEIATLRKDMPGKGRYPKIQFIRNPQLDSNRRDFTINAFYLHPRTGVLLDFHQGRQDLLNRTLRFIGTPAKRIQEDPLRIARAYRFAVTFGLTFESKTEQALQKYLPLLHTVTRTRLQKEIDKSTSQRTKKLLVDILGKNS